MLKVRIAAAAVRITLASCVALAATSRSSRGQTSPSSDQPSSADLQAEVAALKAQLQERDAEIARLKGATAQAPAPAAEEVATQPAPVQPAPAEPNTVPTAAAAPGGEVVKMSAFEVTTTQGHGYVSTNAATAFKTDEPLMDIPQGDTVVTNDLIQDLAYENTTDVLQYFGVQAFAQGEFMTLRGSSSFSLPYIDEMPELPTMEDDAVVDSYEVIKGPAQTLYLNAGLSGVVLKATKKPLPFNQDIFSASIDQDGLYRLTADMTGPIGKVGDAELSYRLVGVYQQGHTYFDNVHDDRDILFPELGIQYHNTSVRVYYNLQTLRGITDGVDIMTPSGNLYTGAGVHEGNDPPGGDVNEYETRNVYAELLQKFSDNWEMRLSGAYWDYTSYGILALAISVDWDNNTEEWIARINDEKWKFWTVFDDFQGHYELGPDNWRMLNRDAFGFAFSSQTDKQAYWTTAAFPYPNGPSGGSITTPVNSVAAINAISVAPTSAFYPPSVANGGPGADYGTLLTALYWQHTMDVIPNWLTLVAGFTWDYIGTTSVLDWAVLPWNATYESVAQWNHRLGAVVHVTKDVSIYALNSTTFTPPATGVILENGQLPPNQDGKGNEIGVKWSFLGGRISGESAWFKEVLSNGLDVTAGTLPNGEGYATLIGDVNLEGVDGDASFTIIPGWQLIGSFYAGHQRDPYNNPIPNGYDNSWSAYTRYNFAKDCVLSGLSLGGGITRIGGRWMSSGGLVYTSGYLPNYIKVQTGTLVNGFIDYRLDKHWSFRILCNNMLDQHYPLGVETAYIIDPSPGRIFSFETSYKY